MNDDFIFIDVFFDKHCIFTDTFKKELLDKALGKAGGRKGVYFLDEPTSGLEREDARLLTAALLSLTSGGATVVFTEHDPVFIEETADHVIDLGTKAGNAGGNIVCTGSPTEVFDNPRSSWADTRR